MPAELNINVHPVYLQELRETDAEIAEGGPCHERMLRIALEIVQDLTNLAASLAGLPSEGQRRLVTFLGLSFLADHGATLNRCEPLVASLASKDLTTGQRYQLAECYSRIGMNHRRGQDLEAALDIYHAGLRAIEGLPARLTTTALYHNLGVAHEQRGEHVLAAASFRDSARLEIALGRPSMAGEETRRAEYNEALTQFTPVQHFSALTVDGAESRQQGNMAKALSHYLVAHQHAVRSGDSEMVALSAITLGGIYFYQGEYEEARQILFGALESAERGPELPATVRLRAALGNALLALGDREEAESQFRRALEIAVRKGWPAEADRCHYGLANIALDRRDYAAAHPLLLCSLAHRRHAGVVDSFDASAESRHRLLGGQRPIMGDYVTGTGATRGATAAGGRSC